ncbi:MAG: superoxide dismutase family protein [Steroidobacteraceae bacterium]
MNRKLVCVSLIPCALLFACSKQDAAVPPSASAPVAAPAQPEALPAPTGQAASASIQGIGDSPVSGNLQFTTLSQGVRVTGEITGLTQGKEQGIHIHELGDCSGPDGMRAGAHFNPGNNPHGAPTDAAHHLGDLSNLEPDSMGTAKVDQLIANATLHDAGVNDLIGRSVVIHMQRDDYKTQPAGDSGSRVACGVIM